MTFSLLSVLVPAALLDLVILTIRPDLLAKLAIFPLRQRERIPWGEVSTRATGENSDPIEVGNVTETKFSRPRAVSLQGGKVRFGYRSMRTFRWVVRMESAWLVLGGDGLSVHSIAKMRVVGTVNGLELRSYPPIPYSITSTALYWLPLRCQFSRLPCCAVGGLVPGYESIVVGGLIGGSQGLSASLVGGSIDNWLEALPCPKLVTRWFGSRSSDSLSRS